VGCVSGSAERTSAAGWIESRAGQQAGSWSWSWRWRAASGGLQVVAMQVIVQPAVADSAGQADGDAVASRLQIAATSTDRLWMAHRGRFVIRLPPLSTAV
jgi:hypothetical protein